MVLPAGCPRSVGVIVMNWIQNVKVPAVPPGLGGCGYKRRVHEFYSSADVSM